MGSRFDDPIEPMTLQNMRENGVRALAVQIPAHRGQSFRRIADSIPVIADSF